jgi:hypothetical protein
MAGFANPHTSTRMNGRPLANPNFFWIEVFMCVVFTYSKKMTSSVWGVLTCSFLSSCMVRTAAKRLNMDDEKCICIRGMPSLLRHCLVFLCVTQLKEHGICQYLVEFLDIHSFIHSFLCSYQDIHDNDE